MELFRSRSSASKLETLEMAPKRKVVCFLLCMAIGSLLAQDHNGSPNRHLSPCDCRATNLETSGQTDISPVSIEHNNVTFTELGHSSLELKVRNRGPGRIEKLALLLEYVDAEGRLIDRVPVVAGVGPGTLKTPPSVLSPANVWKSSLAIGDVVSMATVHDSIRTGYCPVRARITFAKIQFADGKVQKLSSPGWQLGPVPTVIPRLQENVPDLPVEPPVSFIAKLKVSAAGSVLDVVPEESENLKLVDWVRDRMKNWKFHPALVNGRPSDSELTVLFRIHARGMLKFPETQPVLQPITLIQFFWSRDLFPGIGAPDRWTVTYGLLREDSVSEYPFSASVLDADTLPN